MPFIAVGGCRCEQDPVRYQYTEEPFEVHLLPVHGLHRHERRGDGNHRRRQAGFVLDNSG